MLQWLISRSQEKDISVNVMVVKCLILFQVLLVEYFLPDFLIYKEKGQVSIKQKKKISFKKDSSQYQVISYL